MKSSFNKHVSVLMKKHSVPGCSIAIAHNGKIIHQCGYGTKILNENKPVTSRTLFQAASISKPIFAILVMMIDHDKKININKDITSYNLPLAIKERFDGCNITLKQLLSHTAGTTIGGFPGYKHGESIPNTLDIVLGLGNTKPVMPKYMPNSQIIYSGGGVMLAQLIIESVCGDILSNIIKIKLFKPLNINCTFEVNVDKKDHSFAHMNDKIAVGNYQMYPESAAAGLWTSAKDLCIIGIEIGKAIKGKSNVINVNIAKKMLSSVFDEKDGDKIGIGFFLYKDLFYHYGSNLGFSSKMSFDNNGSGCVILTNNEDSIKFIHDIEKLIGLKMHKYKFNKKRKTPILRKLDLKFD